MGHTHILEMAEEGACQDTERNQLSKAHLHAGDSRGLGQVRTQKETEQTRSTHKLETAEEGTRQNIARNRLSEEHSLPGDGRGACQKTVRN